MFADVMATLLESCARASVVLCAAWALTSVMRRASASTRHFVWMCAIAGSILASVIGQASPRWTLPVPSPFESAQPAATSDDHFSVAPAADSASPIPAPAGSNPSIATTPSTPRRAWLDVSALIVLAWAVGALAVLAYVMSGALGAWWIRRSSAPLSAPWVDEAHVLAEALEVPGSLAVVESNVVTMPMVCGLLRPFIVMPPSAAQWTDERRRVVVLHELAHIKRRDCLTQALAQIVCAAYWFNPLVWLAARRLRAERERACDDFVLAAGEKGADYAAHLLDIAQTMKRPGVPATVGFAMARPSQLEGRLLAILDPAIRRSSTLNARLAALGFVMLIALPVGAVQLQGSAPATTAVDAATSSSTPVPALTPVLALTPGLAATPTPAATPTSTPTPTSTSTPDPTPMPTPAPPMPTPLAERRQLQADAVAEAVAQRVRVNVGDALGPELGQQIAAALAGQSPGAADPKTVEALIGALNDADPDVRETVVMTLGRMRDPRIVPALLPLLKDGSADVREQAVFALARTRDARATAAIATLIDDTSPEVREQAVHLLGQSRNREAVPVLLKALKDSSPDVREQAAFALGQLRDQSAVDPLLGMLKDSSPDVREQTVFALGQLRNGKAVDGLIAALTDANADVREKAAFALGQLRDPKALASLTAALRDSVADVREQAAFAIGQISGQQ